MINKINGVLIVVFLLFSCNNEEMNLSQQDDMNSSGNTNVGSNSDFSGDTNSDANDQNIFNSQDWLVPIEDVKDGGPGKDGIPSIDKPRFSEVNSIIFLNKDDLVIGIIRGDDIKAYPHRILDYHEIVNDKINDEFITISYCPLTGTAFGWESYSGGNQSTFGVSGLLYNSNLILYDRVTDSNWSQLGLLCINGKQIGNKPNEVQVIETSWEVWKSLFPNSKVLNEETGYTRNYGRYPYGNYKENDDFLLFPVLPLNSALPKKERVFALIDNGKSKVYQFDKFGSGNAIKEQFNGNGKNYLLVGTQDYIVGYELDESIPSDLVFTYELLINDSVSFFKDNEGNKWSITGEAISGPRKGQKMKPAKSVVSYWFAIAAFYPNPEIY